MSQLWTIFDTNIVHDPKGQAIQDEGHWRKKNSFAPFLTFTRDTTDLHFSFIQIYKKGIDKIYPPSCAPGPCRLLTWPCHLCTWAWPHMYLAWHLCTWAWPPMYLTLSTYLCTWSGSHLCTYPDHLRTYRGHLRTFIFASYVPDPSPLYAWGWPPVYLSLATYAPGLDT
jgi:hypothetical protein